MRCFQAHQEAAKKSADAKREAEKKRKKAELELVKQGKRPFYLKKCKLVWVDKCLYEASPVVKKGCMYPRRGVVILVLKYGASPYRSINFCAVYDYAGKVDLSKGY